VNPQLFGQSRGIGYVQDWNSAQLNAAIDGQKAEQLLAQARDLVGKIVAHGVSFTFFDEYSTKTKTYEH
jgi:hypothetical protein